MHTEVANPKNVVVTRIRKIDPLKRQTIPYGMLGVATSMSTTVLFLTEISLVICL